MSLLCAKYLLSVISFSYIHTDAYDIQNLFNHSRDGWMGNDVSIYQDTALIGALQDCLVYVLTRNVTTGQWFQSNHFSPSDVQYAEISTGDSDKFGWAVSLYGNNALVSSPWDDDKGTNSGSAYIFTYDEILKSWEQAAKLLPNDGVADDRFGFSVALYDNIAIVGAPYRDDSFDGSGSVYVFTYDGSSWTQTAKLIPNDPAFRQNFGHAVALYQNKALIGANPDMGANIPGSAYVFTLNSTSGQWSQEVKLVPNDSTINDNFGRSVALYRGDNALISSGEERAYIFTYNATTGWWTQVAALVPGDGRSNDQFGNSVALSANIAVVGAYFGYDDRGNASGSAYIFAYDLSSRAWNQKIKLNPHDASKPYYLFGNAVFVSDNHLVITSLDGGATGCQNCIAYVYTNYESCSDLNRMAIGEQYLINWEWVVCSTCHEDGNGLTHVGLEEPVNDTIQNLDFLHSIHDNSTIRTTQAAAYYNEILIFKDDTQQQMECNGIVSCQGGSITFRNMTYCNVRCDGTYSCAGRTIYIEGCVQSQIICNGDNSCFQTVIEVNSPSNQYFYLDCGLATSCAQTTVNIRSNHSGPMTQESRHLMGEFMGNF